MQHKPRIKNQEKTQLTYPIQEHAHMSSLWSFTNLFVILMLFAPIPACKSSSSSNLFYSWCKEYDKNYNSEEEKQRRFRVFEENYEYVTRHNENANYSWHNENANYSYTLALNVFADLTNHEFKAKYLGLSPFVDSECFMIKRFLQCLHKCMRGIEGINKIVTRDLVSLSEQELIDCDKTYNEGCGEGLMEYAYEFIIKNKGIDTEADYPYQGREGTCNKNKLKRHVVTINSYADLPAKNEKKLLLAVATQPISVGICGSSLSFQLYSGGIFTGPCPTYSDHAVLIVGYDSKDVKDYWIIKNSWGKYWGMNRYMHMLRNSGNAEGQVSNGTLVKQLGKRSFSTN